MKSLITYCVIFFACSHGVSAQALRQPISAVYLGLSAYSTQQNDVFSFVNNQAALAQYESTAAGVYGERRFMLTETSVYTAAIAIPSALGNFGISARYMGFKNFNENQIGLAYGRSLGKKVDIGVQFNYYGYSVPAYNSDNTINFELGALVHLTDKLNAGLHVYNPVGGKFSKTDEKLTSAYKFGLGYDASDKFFVSAELVKEEDFPVNMNAGFQYQFAKQFFARGGISSANSVGYAGLGLSWSNLRLDVSASYHQQLGVSPGLLLIYNFKSKTILETKQ
jgi:opacity protein-like surface antigen